MKDSKTILLATGGTGGHFFPAEALAETLIKRGDKPVLLTDERVTDFADKLSYLDKYIIKINHNYNNNIIGKLTRIVDIGLAVRKAKAQIKKINPSAVVGFGSYASASVMMAAISLKIPTLVHEQNAALGKANKLLSKRVDRFCTSFKKTQMIPKGVSVHRTGMPIRNAFNSVRSIKYKPPGISGKIRITVLGGSQGAAFFSNIIPDAISMLNEKLKKRILISQQCRPELINETISKYKNIGVSANVSSFFDDVPKLLSESHLILARAGSSTVSEIAYCGRPGIFIPYPSAMDNHQTYNAMELVESGGGWVVHQDNINPKSLSGLVTCTLSNPASLLAAAVSAKNFIKPNATDHLADIIDDMIHYDINSVPIGDFC